MPLTRVQLTRYVGARLHYLMVDESGMEPAGISIYTLSDPRDVRQLRYVGLTAAPRRRFLQHLNTARLWLPDEIPWWVKATRLRPLYEWIRELHLEDYRLPCMLISTWVQTTSEARQKERELIYRSIGQRLPILNVEASRSSRSPDSHC